MKKERNIIVAVICESALWITLLVVGIIALILNFIDGKTIEGIVYSLISLLAVAGLIFNTIYLVKTSKRNLPLPKE